MNCEHCHKVIPEPKRKQRFCNTLCRSAWHNKQRVKIKDIPDLLERAFENAKSKTHDIR
mgnify:CR=1 FL=1